MLPERYLHSFPRLDQQHTGIPVGLLNFTNPGYLLFDQIMDSIEIGDLNPDISSKRFFADDEFQLAHAGFERNALSPGGFPLCCPGKTQ